MRIKPNPIIAGWMGHYYNDDRSQMIDNAEAWADDIRTRDGYGWDEAVSTHASRRQIREALASFDAIAGAYNRK